MKRKSPEITGQLEKTMCTLKDLRIKAGKSREEVANELKVTLSALSNYENGIRSISIGQALVLARFYDVSAEELIIAQINSLSKSH